MESNTTITTDQAVNKTPVINSANKKSPKLFFGVLTLVILIIGGLVGLYLTKIGQDVRQQADTGSYVTGGDYECDKNDANACGGNPDQCHCTGGDLCTGTECDDGIEEACGNQGRSYCDNYQGFGKTCCVQGYECCDSSDGCCQGSGPTNPPNDEPTPTPPDTLITATPTPTPTTTVTPTPTTTITPTPTTPIGPQCLDIEMYNITTDGISNMSEDDDDDLVPGVSKVRFVCSDLRETGLPEDYFYAFRIYEPCGSDYHLTPLELVNENGINGVDYDVTMSGDFMAQCAVCTVDSEGDTVCDWESLTPSVCE